MLLRLGNYQGQNKPTLTVGRKQETNCGLQHFIDPSTLTSLGGLHHHITSLLCCSRAACVAVCPFAETAEAFVFLGGNSEKFMSRVRPRQLCQQSLEVSTELNISSPHSRLEKLSSGALRKS